MPTAITRSTSRLVLTGPGLVVEVTVRVRGLELDIERMLHAPLVVVAERLREARE